MGRYYEDNLVEALVGLDPANPFYAPLLQAALAVEQAENEWYESRIDAFNQLDFDDFDNDEDDIERKYSQLVSNLSVYEFKDKFDQVNPSRRSGTGVIVRVHNTFDLFTVEASLSQDRYVLGEEDDDGVSGYELADDVLAYELGRGEPGIDTLYSGLSAFTSNSSSNKDFFEFIDDDEPGFSPVSDVFKGFQEVPLAWQPKSGFTSQQLQVMNAAGSDYNTFVGPKISAFNSVQASYENQGGGDLTPIFYDSGDPNFPYQNFQGDPNISYNRPNKLPSVLVKETRGFG